MSRDNLALARERIGSTLRERWTLEAVLGVGGMAAVYRARHRNGARVAIKLLHGQVSEDDVLRERFRRESYLANSLGHAGVARVLDDDADPLFGPFIVMELLEGESILDRLERGVAIEPALSLVIAEQTLEVLAAAHERGVVHRDLKPANLFLCNDGTVKVLDFGIARVIEASHARLTRTGVPLGTPAYMAPEQARGLGRAADARADVYALGASLFRMLAGRHVHLGHGAEQIAQVATQRAPALAKVAPHVSPAICTVVDRALQFEPERRYGSAREMQADVRLVRAGGTPVHASKAPGPVPRLVTPPPRTAASKEAARDVTELLEVARERAHALARRPDAFSAPQSVPPTAPRGRPTVPSADDDSDDNMPTVMRPPSASASPAATRAPPSAPPPPRAAATRPLARPAMRFDPGHSSSHQQIAATQPRPTPAVPPISRIPNVPVPAIGKPASAELGRPAPAAPSAGQASVDEPPTLTQALGVAFPMGLPPRAGAAAQSSIAQPPLPAPPPPSLPLPPPPPPSPAARPPSPSTPPAAAMARLEETQMKIERAPGLLVPTSRHITERRVGEGQSPAFHEAHAQLREQHQQQETQIALPVAMPIATHPPGFVPPPARSHSFAITSVEPGAPLTPSAPSSFDHQPAVPLPASMRAGASTAPVRPADDADGSRMWTYIAIVAVAIAAVSLVLMLIFTR